MKTLITANEVNAARKAGQTSLRLPPNAIVTPQAKDDAREFGIALLRGGDEPRATAQAAPSTGMGSQTVSAPFLSSGPGITLARRKNLPSAPSGPQAVPGALNLIEALVPAKGQPGAGYMRWENSEVAWTFEQAHILVVLEGELVLRFAGGEMTAGPGDTLRLEAGRSVTMAAKGLVCCAYGSWFE